MLMCSEFDLAYKSYPKGIFELHLLTHLLTQQMLNHSGESGQPHEGIYLVIKLWAPPEICVRLLVTMSIC